MPQAIPQQECRGGVPRIAYVCADPGVPVFGRKGCSVHVQEVIRALVEAGAEVELFASRVDGEVPPGLEAVRVHALPCPGRGDAAARELACLAGNAALAALLDRRFDMVYERYSLWSHAGMERGAELGIPRLLEVNAPLIEEQAAHRGLGHRAEAEQVAARAFAGATALLAVSEEVAAYLNRQAGARGRVHVVPNAVNPARFPPDLAPVLPSGPGGFTVGFLGTLKPWHGVETLVLAFETIARNTPGSRLLLVGDGPQRESLEAIIRDRRLGESVLFAGAVAPVDVPAWLKSMDVAVAPYPHLDTFYFSPLKIFEYMAAGCAIVASRVGQITGILEDGATAILYPPGGISSLAEALDSLRRDPVRRAELGRAARRAALARHTWRQVAGRILDLAGFSKDFPPRVLP